MPSSTTEMSEAPDTFPARAARLAENLSEHLFQKCGHRPSVRSPFAGRFLSGDPPQDINGGAEEFHEMLTGVLLLSRGRWPAHLGRLDHVQRFPSLLGDGGHARQNADRSSLRSDRVGRFHPWDLRTTRARILSVRAEPFPPDPPDPRVPNVRSPASEG